MITRYDDKGWTIITQRAHGLLSGQICALLKTADYSPSWLETVIACSEHDDVYNEFDIKPLIDSNGAPLDFKSTTFNLKRAKAQIDMALTKSRFISLLIARHIKFTHGKEPKAKAFVAEINGKEKDWLKESGLKKTDIDKAYNLLEFCDAFSLLICQDLIPPENRKLEISDGPNNSSYYLHKSGENLSVEPWPFIQDKFDLTYETRVIKELKFTSDSGFRKSLKSAPVFLRRLTIAKSK